MSFDLFDGSDPEYGDSDYDYSDYEEDQAEYYDDLYGEGNWEYTEYGEDYMDDMEENWSDYYDSDQGEEGFFDTITDFASENPEMMMMGAGAAAIPAMMAMKVYILILSWVFVEQLYI